ncbi:MAG: DNA repair protein RecO [Gammaproteobacteria bacterium]|nr:DNA repair protein RecO [Gammaproteobacteria bacterium]
MNAVRRVELAESWVLHSRPFRETSLIVEAFSREFGRMGLVARGGRRPRSALALAARPFRPLLLSWAGRGELATLTAAETTPQHSTLAPPAGETLLAAMYLNELVLRLTRREDPHPELFDHYSQALGDLSAAGPMEPVLRRFELDMLASLGFGLNLRHDIEGRDLAPEAAYCYRMEQGAEALPNGARTGEAMNFSGAELLGIERGDWGSRDIRRAARRLLRTAIDFYLEGKPLNTRKVFAAMR